MKLEKIKINTYRSIINQEINLSENCIGFIGLNEAGKTNVLNSIRSLDNKFKLRAKDKSKINGAVPNLEYYFSFSNKELAGLIKVCNQDLVDGYSFSEPEDVIEDVIKDMQINNVVLKKTLVAGTTGIEEVLTSSYELKIKYSNKYKYLSDPGSIPEKESLIVEGNSYPLIEFKILQLSLIPEEFKNSYITIPEEMVLDSTKEEIHQFILKNLPPVKYWEYSTQYLLPSEMTYEDFLEEGNPKVNSAPLYNMFLIAKDLDIRKISDLKTKVEEWRSDSSLRRKASNILTAEVNKHIKDVWEDYDQELNIELEENKIIIHVNDPKNPRKNYYEMESRSQGFKTFISFILTVSAEAASGVLENFILILDEPETHLHPSGVKYMKNELLKLASFNNNVFFATHSIFMIDRTNLKRHYIVKKNAELTKLIRVERNNILQEDVIYEALGTAVDEFSISNLNILFEGELDVKLFSFFLEKCIEKRSNHLRDYELLDGGGTKTITKFFTTKVLPRNSKWTVILDNDAPGRNLPDIVKHSSLGDVNIDFVYYSSSKDYELEDILPKSLVLSSFQKAKVLVSYEETFSLDLDQPKAVGTLIEEYYNRNRINNKEEKGRIEENFKIFLEEEILNVLTHINKETTISNRKEKFAELLPEYFLFIKKVLEENFSMRID